MARAKKPRIKTPERDDDDEPLPPTVREAEYMDYWWYSVRQKIATYAFGTIVCVATMVTLAAWMGGSLGAFGQRLQAGTDRIAQMAGFSIRRIEIVGLDPIVEERAREVANIHVGGNMFGADPYKIRDRVEALEAVAGVSVHRFWPDQVTVIAETRDPMALWQLHGEWRVIDQRGRAFAQVSPSDYMDLPRIVGEEGGPAAAGLLTLIADYPDLATRMESATRISSRRWDVKFEGGVTVAMPEDKNLKLALQSLNLINARSRVLDLPVTHIDARDPEKLAIRPAPGRPSGERA